MYVKLYFSSPVYSGMASLKDTEVISQVRCWKVYYKRNQEGCEEGWKMNPLTCIALSSTVNTKVTPNFREFILGKWHSGFKGKHTHTNTQTLVNDAVKQNSKQSCSLSLRIRLHKLLLTYDSFNSLTSSHSRAKVTKIYLSWAQKFHLPFRDFLNEMTVMNINQVVMTFFNF